MKYIICIEASDGNLEQVKRIAGERLAQEPEDLRQSVEFRYGSFPIRDYGINPLADRDSRSFVDLITPNGDSMLPLSDIALRVGMSGTEHFVGWCLDKIKEDVTTPAPN